LKSQQQVQAQLEEQRKKEEVISQGNQDEIHSSSTMEHELSKCKEELSKKFNYIIDLESRVETYEQVVVDNKNEIETLETRLREKNNMLIELENNYVNIEGVRQLQCDVDEKNAIINELEERLRKISNNPANCDKDDLQELNDLLDIISTKENRIGELENALRESVQICTEREVVLQQEEHKRKKIMEKVSKLEQRLLSLQAAQAMRCHSCGPIVSRMNNMEMKLTRLIAERKENFQELANMKREALEAAISEKDAHLALLEMTGIRNARQADEVDRLKMDKRRLVERLKQENELSVSLIEGSDDSISLEDIHSEDLGQSYNGKPIT
ncbi:hypothetical protein AMK59_5579, partial [Oryctes borbonicus]